MDRKKDKLKNLRQIGAPKEKNRRNGISHNTRYISESKMVRVKMGMSSVGDITHEMFIGRVVGGY